MTKQTAIRVLIVDDHILLQEGIAAMLKDFHEIEIAGYASSGEEAVQKATDLEPDVILMDIMMEGMTGIEATRWIKEQNGKIKIVLLTSELKKELVSVGIQSGIDGYLLKNTDKGTLIEAIRMVHKGERYFNEAITKLVFEDFFQKEKTSNTASKLAKSTALTKRENEVLALVASGRSNKEVADDLFISIKTVETHKTNILEKLGLRNTAELVKYAIKKGLVSME
jgi:DNA-binding NarL/FixJ family response regulator